MKLPMGIFGKKEDEFERQKDSPEGRKITRKLKDLNPENKKKRKEPPKPWGRKERIIVLVALLATTIISAILLFENSFRLYGGNFGFTGIKINLGSINIFKGETIVIKKK